MGGRKRVRKVRRVRKVLGCSGANSARGARVTGAREKGDVMRRVVLALLVTMLATPLQAQDKAAEVIKEMRKALGGDKLESMRALSVEGPFRREMGARQMEGTQALTIQLPNQMYRSEDLELPGGMSVERMAALNGDTAWEDVKQRGGMGGGMQIMTRGPDNRELNPQAIEEARLRRTQNEMLRHLLAFFGGATQQPAYVAAAEAPDGKADVLEVKNEGGASVRIFVDRQTHLPLMLQYQEVRPMMRFEGGRGGRGGPGAGAGTPGASPEAGGQVGVEGRGGRGREPGQTPDPEAIRRRREQAGPPQPSTVNLFLADFKKVDGVMIPHRLTQSIEGKPVEEWTLEKVKVNPSIKADLFEKK